MVLDDKGGPPSQDTEAEKVAENELLGFIKHFGASIFFAFVGTIAALKAMIAGARNRAVYYEITAGATRLVQADQKRKAGRNGEASD